MHTEGVAEIFPKDTKSDDIRDQLSASPDWATPPSSAAPSLLPTSPAETPRSSYGPLPTSFASPEPEPLSSLMLLAAILHEPSPISPFVPAPSYALRPLILLGSAGLLCGLLPNRLTTRSPKSLGLIFLRATVLLVAQHEAAEARCLGFPLFPLDFDNGLL